MDIDLVYLWVDGSDPAWRKRRDEYIGIPTLGGANCEGRFANNDELKYSLRSIAINAPWIRKIFIVSDGQTPAWLNTNNHKVVMIHQADIMPKECSPCFNSMIIEHHLHNIPGLAEHFLYANDDMFLNKPVTPETFFANDGLPIVRAVRRPLRRLTLLLKEKISGRENSIYNQSIHNAALLIEKHYGYYPTFKPHHNIDAFLKSTYHYARQLFDTEIATTLLHHKRSAQDIQRQIYSYVAIAEKKAYIRYVSQHESFRLHIDNHKHYKKLLCYNPLIFCMNDSQYATDYDRQLVRQFLEEHFPNKSEFEK